MKIIRHFLIAVLLAVITLAAWMGYHLGAFKSVSLDEVEKGPLKMIYKDHTGAYYKNSEVISEVETWAKEHKVDCTRSFGEYIDDPNTVEEARLRSRGGCLVSEFPTDLPPDYKTREIPSRKYVMAVFTGSPGIGPLKVYPKAESYIREHDLTADGAVIEIYVVHSETDMVTTYLFPVTKR